MYVELPGLVIDQSCVGRKKSKHIPWIWTPFTLLFLAYHLNFEIIIFNSASIGVAFPFLILFCTSYEIILLFILCSFVIFGSMVR